MSPGAQPLLHAAIGKLEDTRVRGNVPLAKDVDYTYADTDDTRYRFRFALSQDRMGEFIRGDDFQPTQAEQADLPVHLLSTDKRYVMEEVGGADAGKPRYIIFNSTNGLTPQTEVRDEAIMEQRMDQAWAAVDGSGVDMGSSMGLGSFKGLAETVDLKSGGALLDNVLADNRLPACVGLLGVNCIAVHPSFVQPDDVHGDPMASTGQVHPLEALGAQFNPDILGAGGSLILRGNMNSVSDLPLVFDARIGFFSSALLGKSLDSLPADTAPDAFLDVVDQMRDGGKIVVELGADKKQWASDQFLSDNGVNAKLTKTGRLSLGNGYDGDVYTVKKTV